MDDQGRPVVWALVTGAPPARDVDKLVNLAQADGWQVCVFASPAGRHFIDTDALATKTGYTVRSEYREPGTVSSSPPPDVIIAAPITCNRLAKWATGISDTLPLGILVSAVAWGTPTVAMPFSNRIQLSHPGVQEAIRKLSEWGSQCWLATRSTNLTSRGPAAKWPTCFPGTSRGRRPYKPMRHVRQTTTLACPVRT